MKTASIIIPTFNRADLVHRAIDSALGQTYPCEVILCDHGSTDNTPEIAARYKDKIRYIRREEDKGPIVCWRDGIEQATGEIVHFTYDDDWLEPTFMEKTIARLDDDVGFVYSAVAMYDQDTGRTKCGVKHPPGIRPMKDIVRFLLRCPLVVSPGCVIFRRKDALKNLLLEIPNAGGVYGRDSGVGEDLLLLLLTSLDYPKYAHVAEPLACFLSHSGSITVSAHLSGARKDLVNAYANAKRYYFSRPGSLSPPSALQRLLFVVKWKYKAGALVETALRVAKQSMLKVLHSITKVHC